MVSVEGEEEFNDFNGDGEYTEGEPFWDIGEPFVDANDNNTHDLGEDFVDLDGGDANAYDGPNGTWDERRQIWMSAHIAHFTAPYMEIYVAPVVEGDTRSYVRYDEALADYNAALVEDGMQPDSAYPAAWFLMVPTDRFEMGAAGDVAITPAAQVQTASFNFPEGLHHGTLTYAYEDESVSDTPPILEYRTTPRYNPIPMGWSGALDYEHEDVRPGNTVALTFDFNTTPFGNVTSVSQRVILLRVP
jgi:hypothetical protein